MQPASSNMDDKRDSLRLWDSDGEDNVPVTPSPISNDPLSTPDEAQFDHSAQNRLLHDKLPGYSQLGLCSMFQHVSEQSENVISATGSGNNLPHIEENTNICVALNNITISREEELGKNIMEHSPQAAQFLGRRVPDNTFRALKVGFKVFAQFVLFLISKPDAELSSRKMAAILLEQQLETLPGPDETEKKLVKIVLIGITSAKMLDANCQQRLRNFLIEFCSGYISKKTKKPFAPSTMSGYVRSVQQLLSDLGYRVNLFSGHIFDCPRCDLKAAMDNKFATAVQGKNNKKPQCTNARRRESYFQFTVCNARNANGFQTCFIFVLCPELGTRPTEFCNLEKSRYRLTKAPICVEIHF